MRATESFKKTFDAAGNGPSWSVNGGRYSLGAHSASWGGGSLNLAQLLPDGTTFFTLLPLNGDSALGADGVVYYDLPPGTVRLVLATTTAAQASLTRVPLE